MIEMELFEIRIDETSSEQVIVLRERDGERLLPIVIGTPEAHSIHIKINNIQPPRPMTHDLIVRVIQAIKARVVRILINDLQNSTFYARLILKGNNGEVDVDCRPSDAIALALRAEVPIYVEEDVLTQLHAG